MFRMKNAKKLIAYLLLVILLAMPLSAGAANIKIIGMNVSATTTTVGSLVSWYGATVTGLATSEVAEFMFTLRRNSTSGPIVDVQTWGGDYYSYSPTEIGTYYLTVIARKQNAKTVISSPYLAPTVTAVGTGPKIASVSPSTTLVKTGSSVTFTVYNADGGEGAIGNTGTVWYEYSLYKDTNDLIATSTRASSRYTAALTAPGDYYVIARASDSVGTSAWVTSVPVTAYSNAPVVSAVNVSKTVVPLGNSLTVTAKVTGGYGAYSYFWTVFNKGTKVDSLTSSEASITYTPQFHGIYTFNCEVRDAAGNISNAVDSPTVSVTAPKALTIESVIPPATTVNMNSTLRWNIYVSGGIGAKVLNYTIYKDGSIYYTSTATLSASSTSTPVYCYVTEAGTYTIEVSVKDAADATDFYDKAKPIVVKDTETLTLSNLTPSVNKLSSAATVTWTFDYHNNKGGVRTRYHILKDGAEVYTYLCGGHTFSYKITEFGVYTVLLESTDLVTGAVAKLSGGTVDFSLNGSLTITNLQAHESPLTQGGTARWIFNVPDAKGKLTVWYSVYKSGVSAPVAAGKTNSTSFTANLKEVGDYYVAVEVMDESGRPNATASGGVVTVTEAATSSMSLEKLKASPNPVELGNPIVWTFSAKNAYGPVTIYYTIYKDGVAVTTGQLNDDYTISYTPTETGKYHVQIQARDSLGLSKMIEGGTVTVKVPENPSLDVSVPTSDASVYIEGDTITWTFNVLNCTGDYTAYYSVYNEAGNRVLTSATHGNSFVHKPNNPGTFYVQVQIRDDTGALSPVRTSAKVEVKELVIDPTELTVSIPTASASKITSPGWITWSWKVSSMNEDVKSYYTLYCNYDGNIRTVAQGSTTTKREFSTFVDRPGNYYAIVQAVDSLGNTSNFGRGGWVTASMPEAVDVTPAASTLPTTFSITNTSTSPSSVPVGKPVTFSWNVTGGTATAVYVSVYNSETGAKAAYQKLGGTAGYLNFTPSEAGSFYAQIQAVDADGNTTPVGSTSAVTVEPVETPAPTFTPAPTATPEPAGFHVKASAPATVLVNGVLKVSVNVVGGTAARVYFTVYKDGAKRVSTSANYDVASFNFIPKEAGEYVLQLQAVDAKGNVTPVTTLKSTAHVGFMKMMLSAPVSEEEVPEEDGIIVEDVVEAVTEETVEVTPEVKVEETVEAAPAEVKVEETVEAAPAEVKVEETVEAAPAEVKVEETVEAAPAEVKVEETVEAAPAEVKAEEVVEAAPAEVKVEETVEAAPAEVKAEEVVEAAPAEVKVEETVEAVPAEEKTEEPAAEALPEAPAAEPVQVGSLNVNTTLASVGTKLVWSFKVTSGKAASVTCKVWLRNGGVLETFTLTGGTSFTYTPAEPGTYYATIEAVDAQGNTTGIVRGGSVTVE